MSIFGKIKDAIFGKARAEPAPSPTIDSTQVSGTPKPTPAPTPSTTVAVPEIDVTNSLDSMPGADRLNWRTSIVDLMKLIGVDSDYDSRKALAQEMGRTDYSGTAEDNVWLHRKVMGELSRNGGKVPAEFLD